MIVLIAESKQKINLKTSWNLKI